MLDENNSALYRSMQRLINNVSFDLNPYKFFLLKFYYAYCQNSKALGQEYDSDFVKYYETPIEEIFKREQVQAFVKIYYALRNAQSEFFKTDWVKDNNINNLSLDDAYNLITGHAKKPDSLTQKAWELVIKYKSDTSPENINLIKNIYTYGFKQSGFFKRSTSFGHTYYTTSDVEARLQFMRNDGFKACIGEGNTRLNNVVKSLGR